MKKILFVFLFAALVTLCGCQQQSPLAQAQRHVAAAGAHVRSAEALYKELLAAAPDSPALRYDAGMLYYHQGDFDSAVAHFRASKDPRAQKFLAIALYRSGDYAAALEACNRQDRKDDEFKYYEGLSCEKLNLFDRALKTYRDIKDPGYARRAQERMLVIEKEANPLRIGDIDPDVSAILARCPAPAAYPQAGSLILLSDEQFEVTPDNKAVYRLHYIVRILNERGKENFSEAPIEYDSTDEKVNLEYARTIRPDGTVVDVGSRHIRDVSKYLNFPLYSNARVFIISFPAISEGATIEYAVTVTRSQLVNTKDFVIPVSLQTQDPVIDSRFSLILPKGRPVNLKTINERYNIFGAGLAPAISETAQTRTYRWSFKDIPQIIPEPEMPPLEDVNPTILISSFGSWREIYDWWWKLAKDKIKADGAIKQKVSELTRNAAGDDARLRAIHNFCAQKIRYVAVEYGQAGYEPHQAADIFQNKYGDCKDQAILLVTMLKEAGFTAWPVLIPTRDSFNMNTDFPSMLFNHCIAAVAWKGKTVFMDPTAETCSFGDLPAGDQDRTVLVIKDDGFEVAQTPLYPAGHNTLWQRLSLTVAGDEAVKGERSVSSAGVYDQAQRYWLLYTVPDVVKDRLSAKVQEISIGARLDGYAVDHLDDLSASLVLRYSFHGPEFLTPAGPLRIMPALAGLDMSAITKTVRAYPIEYEMLDQRNIETAIALPPGYTIRYMPDPISEENRWMKYDARYTMQASTLMFRQTVESRARVIPQEEYPAYKDFIEQLGKRVKQRVVLERKK
jgi:cellulose synthase operon protein C